MTIALIDGDVLVYQAIWGTSTLEEAQANFDDLVKGVIENTFTEDYAMAIGTKLNFRKDLFNGYKGNRDKAKDNRAEYHAALAKWASEKDYAVACLGYEADDLLRVWSNDCIRGGESFIICSVDKDLKCIPGHYYDLRKQTIEVIEEDPADFFYWQQVLQGDSTDNIPGIPGVGPVKAKKMLEGSTKKERKGIVCREYYNVFGDEGYYNLITNGRLIHIWRHMHDYFKVSKEDWDEAINKA